MSYSFRVEIKLMEFLEDANVAKFNVTFSKSDSLHIPIGTLKATITNSGKHYEYKLDFDLTDKMVEKINIHLEGIFAGLTQTESSYIWLSEEDKKEV